MVYLVVLCLMLPLIYMMSSTLIARLGYNDYVLTRHHYMTQSLQPSLEALFTGNKEVIHYLKKNLTKQDVIFAFDRGALYDHLPDAKINFYLNNRMIDLFSKPNKKALYEALKEENITYVFASYYKPFILTESAFADLLADPTYVSLVMNAGYYELFKLNDEPDFSHQFGPVIKKKHVHLAPQEASVFDMSLDEKDEYLIEVDTTQQHKAMYSLNIIKQLRNQNTSLMSLTSDRLTWLWFSTNDPSLKRADGHKDVTLSFNVSSKDKPVDLVVSIKRLAET